MRRRFTLLLCWLGAAVCLFATEPPAAKEDQKIEALLAKLTQQADVQFVRNGSTYDAAIAVKFLHGKWDRQRDEIKTVQDFIDKAATKSSTSGQPYLIKFKDGHTVECRDYLAQLLKAP